MSVDHGRAHIAMTQQLLHGPDIVTRLEELRGERMPQRVTCRALGDACRADRLSHRPLHDALVHMMPPPLPGRLIPVHARRGKHPLPHPLPSCPGQLARESARELHVARSPREVRPVLPLDSPQMLPESPARGSIVTRSRAPFPRRTTISPRPKSMSFTRNVSASSSRNPDPYKSSATSRVVPCIRPNTARTSSRVSTTGTRPGSFACTTPAGRANGRPNTSSYKNRRALAAWFWVVALTPSSARLDRNRSTSASPSEAG